MSELTERKQPPFPLLNELLSRGELVFFLGAGASSQGDESEESAAPAGLPEGKTLARRLAKRLTLPPAEVDTDNLLDVASCYEILADRLYLENELADIFRPRIEPLAVHRFVAQALKLRLIITTNYDLLIEKAFHQQNRAFHVIMTPVEKGGARHDLPRVLWWQPGAQEPTSCSTNEWSPVPEDLPVIYKFHGGFDPTGQWQPCTITDDDYFEIGGRIYNSSLIPQQIHAQLERSSLLFLGYSLRDMHVRQMINRFSREYSLAHHLVTKKIVSSINKKRYSKILLHVYDALTIDALLEGLEPFDSISEG